ncbi:MAG TPA: hypothetical protein VFM21_10835 [Terriglobia bacterium]|nr:hypothetical protein [Terriglobia bacterium]
MRDALCLVLVAVFFSATMMEARAGATVPGAPEESKAKPTLKERIIEVPPGTMIEVKLLNKQKIRGRLGELTDEGFSLTTAQGEKITTQKIAFTEVKSFKKVEGGKGGHAVVYALAGAGIIFVVLLIVALSQGLGG